MAAYFPDFHRRPIVIASAVALLHVGGLAALQSGLLVRAYEMVVPVEIISQIALPPQPKPPAPPPPPAPAPTPPEPVKNKAPTLPPAPQPLATADTTPTPNAPVVAPDPPAPPTSLPLMNAPVAAVAPPAAPPAAPAPSPAPKVELPRSDADYLNNPPPPYPPLSKRMGEQGRVMVRVCVDEKGIPQKSELHKSSGFERLDSTAVATTMRWRYKPGTRGGIPEALCALIPIEFRLDN